MQIRKTVAVMATLMLSATALHAQQTQLNLLPYVNDALTLNYCCDSPSYPTSGFGTNLGVTFDLSSDKSLNNVWRGEWGTGRSLSLPVGISGLTNVYTLINTRFGYGGDPADPTTAMGSLTFNFSGGSFTQYLWGCYNLRDHNPAGFSSGCWPLNGSPSLGGNAQQWGVYGAGAPVVHDMQTWDVSAYSGQTLNSIRFDDYGPGANSIFLRAVTVESRTTLAPEPATWALLVAGMIPVGLLARRRNRKTS